MCSPCRTIYWMHAQVLWNKWGFALKAFVLIKNSKRTTLPARTAPSGRSRDFRKQSYGPVWIVPKKSLFFACFSRKLHFPSDSNSPIKDFSAVCRIQRTHKNSSTGLYIHSFWCSENTHDCLQQWFFTPKLY